MNELTDVPPVSRTNAYWRSLQYFNFFRLIIAFTLLGVYFFRRNYPSWPIYNDQLYLTVVSNYVGFSIVAAAVGAVTIAKELHKWPRVNRQLTLLVIGDISFITLLMHASGGVRSGFGLLLIVAIAAASLVNQGRQALVYAMLATIAVLLEQSYQLLMEGRYDGYSHVLMLGVSFFATTGLAHYFAKRTQLSEELASQRGVDLENLASVNQLVIRDMQDGVLVVDKNFKLRHLNSQAERLMGMPTQAWKELPLENYSHHVAKQLRAWVDKTQESGGVAVTTIGGRELRLRFLPIGADRQQGSVIFLEDWSRIQNQAQQIKLAALGRLTANIAHEIRNPLSAIGHASQLLLEDEHLDTTTQRLLQIIQDNVQRLDNIVQDVMQLNRRDRAQIVALPVQMFLYEFADQFCQIENIPRDGVALEMIFSKAVSKMPEEQIAIAFDRHHLHQILWNLCRNGWRHSRKQSGSVRLRVEESTKNGIIFLDVMDDGPGVAEDALPRLFEPFFTTESTGTGLGLYIARELSEANEARLEYVQLTQGGYFRIYAKKYGS